jgi:hypothetical protein
MTDLERLVIKEKAETLTILEKAGKSRSFTFIISVCLLGLLGIGVAGTQILSAGQFGGVVTAAFLFWIGGMFLLGTIFLCWNWLFTRELCILPTKLVMNWDFFLWRWCKEIPSHSVTYFTKGKPWPYHNIDADYEIFRRGIWHIRLYHKAGKIQLFSGLNREQADRVAHILQERGFRMLSNS